MFAEKMSIMKSVALASILMGFIHTVQSRRVSFIIIILAGLQIRVCTGMLFFLLLNQNICCGYYKEPSQWDGSFEHLNHIFKLMGKEIHALLDVQTILVWTHVKLYTN